MSITSMTAAALSTAALQIEYRDLWDLYSLRWHLTRSISPALAGGAAAPADGEAYVYAEPLRGVFQRPAITLQLITGSPIKHLAYDPSSDIHQRFALRIYDVTHDRVMALSERVYTALGGRGGRQQRVPLWAWFNPDSEGFPTQRLRLGRSMRLVADSLAMSLEEPDDDRQWSRGLDAAFVSPRNRNVHSHAPVNDVVLNINGHSWSIGG